MDIKTINTPAVSGRSNSDPGKPVAGDAATAKPSVSDESGNNIDKVTLTEMQGKLRALEQKTQSINNEREERIAQIREAINNGSYQVNSEKVAEKLMQTEILLSRV
ncbi:flagellar biosynthesis anti-sigma factor FlgM [Thiomicrorhabdus xiamenensis]|uniref:Negative regulator of flagellin synthesis n=1 Tax=Thiomicrorhabdus xiamenensis TaxID=2739063 RepID=A0A7D4NQW7_9GAMM|nr:flagellar biosynthesis anti-sigma factor FlgM [Thiomicrorhabdus xiamenensis]QKI89591.1 flagellar biosynthesis anti-sigma factor FlgM [Thiomicrorhabdus xiamenensis]